MLSVSPMIAFIRALHSIDCRDTSRNALPNRRPSRRKIGSTVSPSTVRRQSRASMIASVPVTCITLVAISTSVLVTALCAPTTSLFRRLINSPVLLLVKKRSDMLCRRAYKLARKSRIIPEPIVTSSFRCQMRMMALTTGMATRATAIRLRRAVTFSGNATSMRSRTIRGVSKPSPIVATMLKNSKTIRPT